MAVLKRNYRILIAFLLILSSSSVLKAQNVLAQLGGGPNQLRITIRDNGSFLVERETSPGNGVWAKQMFRNSNSPFFGIRIGSKVYNSYSGGFTIGEDTTIVGGAGNTRTEFSVTFRHLYNSSPFSVTITTIYDTSNPDYFILSAKINTIGITETVSFGYGYDAYVNNSDRGYAFIIPDHDSYNNIDSELDVYFTSPEIRELQLIGSINGTNQGAFMGFFNMGTAFDRAYSANPYGDAYPTSLLTNTNNFKFQFGPITAGKDNGVGVVFDSIPSNSIQVVNTGLTFSGTLDGTLDYMWDGSKDKTVGINDVATLSLDYKTYSLTPLAGIAFKVGFPGLAINGSCTNSGWTSIGSSTCTSGSSFYQISNAAIEVNGHGFINVPIKVLQYGQWEVNAGLVSETAKTLPTGDPAILRVRTDVNLTSMVAQEVCPNGGATYTVTLDGASDKTTSQNIVVNLNYTGDTDQFDLPASVTIPAGAHSASFTITAKSTAVSGSSVVFTLGDIDYPSDGFASVGSSSSSAVSVKHIPVLTSSTIIPETCGKVEYTAVGSPGTTITGWSRAVVTEITPTTGSGTSAIVDETLSNSSDYAKTVTYTFTLTNSNGCSNTQDVTVVVNPSPILAAISNQTVCAGSSTTAVPFDGSNVDAAQCTWTNSNPAIGLAASGTGSLPAFTATNATATPISATITVTPKSSDGCTGTIKTFTITVNPSPVLTAISDQTVCAGSSTTAVPFDGGNVDAAQCTWTNSNPAIGLAANGTGSLPAFTATNATATPISATITVTPKSSDGCTGTIKTFTITVNPSPVLTAISDQTVCAGSSTTAVPFDGSNVDAAQCTWTNSNPAIGLAANGTGSLPAFIATNATASPISATITVMPKSLTGCVSPAKTFTITVNPKPSISSKMVAICSGSTFTVSPTNGSDGDVIPSGTTYTWTVSANANITGASNQTTDQPSISQTLTNTSNTEQTVTYMVTPILSGGCAGSAFTVTVTVNPKPSISSKTVTICSSSTFTISPTNGSDSDIVPSGTTYTWTVSANTNITGAADQAVNQPGISQTLTNTSTSSQVIIYTVTPTFGSCTGSAFTITVTVNPTPKLSNASKVISPICSDGTVAYIAASATSGVAYAWKRNAVAGITPAPSGAPTNSNTINETLSNTTTSPITVTYEYTLTANGCSNIEEVTVIVNPRPIATISGDNTPCKGSRHTYTTELAMTNYTWTVTGGAIVSGQGTGSLTVDWQNAPGTGLIAVAYTNANGCTPASPSQEIITIQDITEPTISGTFSVWQNSEWTYTTELGKSSYAWEVTGGTIINGQGTNTLRVKWTHASSGTIKISYRDGGATACLADMVNPKVVAISNAQLAITLSGSDIEEGGASITGEVCLPTSTVAPVGGIMVTLSAKASSTASASDYAMPSTLTILEGDQCATFTISATNDDWLEGNEQLAIAASATGLSDAEATLTIIDRTDGLIIVEKYKPAGGDASEPNVDGSFCIRFKDENVKPVKPVTVSFKLSGASAATYTVKTVAGSLTYDAFAAEGTAVIPANSNSVEVAIEVIANYVVEGTRNLKMEIFGTPIW